jgi:hypothetical protein
MSKGARLVCWLSLPGLEWLVARSLRLCLCYLAASLMAGYWVRYGAREERS